MAGKLAQQTTQAGNDALGRLEGLKAQAPGAAAQGLVGFAAPKAQPVQAPTPTPPIQQTLASYRSVVVYSCTSEGPGSGAELFRIVRA